jgi:hypothetical protein
MCKVSDDVVDSWRAELALLAARFVLPGLGPDVDRAINVACDLVARGLDTPGTVGVAALAYGTPLRDAGPVIREMLSEQGFAAAGPDASDAEQFATVLRAVGAGGLGIGEFYGVFMARVPARDRQDELERSLVVLLGDWEAETTPDGRAAVAAAVRRVARDAVSERG